MAEGRSGGDLKESWNDSKRRDSQTHSADTRHRPTNTQESTKMQRGRDRDRQTHTKLKRSRPSLNSYLRHVHPVSLQRLCEVSSLPNRVSKELLGGVKRTVIVVTAITMMMCKLINECFFGCFLSSLSCFILFLFVMKLLLLSMKTKRRIAFFFDMRECGGGNCTDVVSNLLL